nr:FAD-binding oxidoreductase [Sediminibacillus massiliensis]
MAEYIVIGGGILGASTAFRLAKAGADVTVIDRFDSGQATDAAAGIVCPWLSQRRNKAWYQLARGGAAYYPSLIRELEQEGETETGYKQVGAISIHHDENKLDGMETRALKRRQHAPEIGEITRLNAAETREMFPPLAEGFSSVHVSGAARVDGRSLRSALLRGAMRHGAKCMEGNARLYLKNSKVTGVEVNGSVLQADKVIIAAGAWAKSILKPLGIDFNLHFQKAQIVHLEIPDMDTSRWPVVIPPSNHYLLAFDHNRIVAGATHEDNTGFDDRITVHGIKEIFEKALGIAPGLAHSTFLEARVGFRPFTPGFLPMLGALPDHPNVFAANGLGASGLTMGPYVGAQLAKLALEQETEINLEDYDITGAIGSM